MKVGLIAPFIRPVCLPSTGGLETCVYLLAYHLAKRGHEVSLFAAKESYIPGVEIIHFDIYAKDVKYTLPIEKMTSMQLLEFQEREIFVHQNILSYIASQSFDIVHSHTWFWLYFSLTPFMVNQPIVHTLYQIANFPDLVNVIKLLPKHVAKQFVAISSIVADSYTTTTGLSIDKVIHFGIDSELLGSYEPGTECAQFVWIGRMIEEKGPDIAIQIAEAAKYKLLLIGPIDDTYFFERKIKPHLNSKIQYLGIKHWNEIRYLMQTSTALLVTTRFPEGFSWVALEALAWGCPVITTTKCGILEIKPTSEYIFELEHIGVYEISKILERLSKIDRENLANIVRKELPIEKMINEYENYFTNILKY